MNVLGETSFRKSRQSISLLLLSCDQQTVIADIQHHFDSNCPYVFLALDKVSNEAMFDRWTESAINL